MSGGAGPAPEGVHFNNSTEVSTPLSTCLYNPYACPVSTQGVANRRQIFTTGAEIFAYNPGIQFKLSGFAQQLNSLQPGALGREDVSLGITVGPGYHYLTVTSNGPANSAQSLPVNLGPAN
jgi:hypothetical protein